jgi:hypothetical protein
MIKVLYENGSFWVCKAKHGYEVYKDGVSHATRVAIIGYESEKGLQKAIAEADRRARCIMTDNTLDDPFHAIAFTAFVEQAKAVQGWPESERVKQAAYRLYEQHLKDRQVH